MFGEIAILFAVYFSQRNKIIVVGIPTSSTAEDLCLLCRPFGAVQDATVVSDADGTGRGFGCVRFETEEAQLTAIEKLDKTALSPDVHVGGHEAIDRVSFIQSDFSLHFR